MEPHSEQGGIVNMGLDVEAPPPSYDSTVSQHSGRPTTGASANELPSYESVGEAPPSYESLYGQMRAAKAESNSVLDFVKKFVYILLNTIGFTIGIALLLAIPISMIVIGAIYLHQCPRQPYIPIFLIVGGSFGVMKNLLNVAQRVKRRNEQRNDSESGDSRANLVDGTITCFLVAWFIAGNVWVYGINGDYSSNPASSQYCNSTVYLFSFWLITGIYIMFGLLVCCVCLSGCIFAGLATTESS